VQKPYDLVLMDMQMPAINLMRDKHELDCRILVS